MHGEGVLSRLRWRAELHLQRLHCESRPAILTENRLLESTEGKRRNGKFLRKVSTGLDEHFFVQMDHLRLV